MSTPDRVEDLAGTIAGLDERPVTEHPDVLEAAHRVLVAELDLLAGGPRPNADQ